MRRYCAQVINNVVEQKKAARLCWHNSNETKMPTDSGTLSWQE